MKQEGVLSESFNSKGKTDIRSAYSKLQHQGNCLLFRYF